MPAALTTSGKRMRKSCATSQRSALRRTPAKGLAEDHTQSIQSSRSILDRMFRGIDDSDLDWPPRRLHPETELFLERGEDRRAVKRGVAARGIGPPHLIRGQHQ